MAHPSQSGDLAEQRPSTQRGNILDRALERLSDWRSRLTERNHLQQLDDRMLKDIGISRADVYRLTHKPFWRV